MKITLYSISIVTLLIGFMQDDILMAVALGVIALVLASITDHLEVVK
ncbi:hypothetical protein V7183_18685 [Bacillus sp. JJ1127]